MELDISDVLKWYMLRWYVIVAEIFSAKVRALWFKIYSQTENILLQGCRNFVVETDMKYLAEMLNNPRKMSNATINYWVNYIRMNFFFKIVYKKRPLD